MHLLGRLVQQHFSLDLENKKWLYCWTISSSCTHDWCYLACGMAALSKEQFWHISPAGFYQIKELSPLPPVSSKSGWEMLKTQPKYHLTKQWEEHLKVFHRGKSTFNARLISTRSRPSSSRRRPGWIQLPNGAEPINMGDFHSMEFKGILISRF